MYVLPEASAHKFESPPSFGLINTFMHISNIMVLIQFSITYVMDDITDDLTLYRPTGVGDSWEVHQVQRCPETQNRSATIKVYEQLPGPQSLT